LIQSDQTGLHVIRRQSSQPPRIFDADLVYGFTVSLSEPPFQLIQIIMRNIVNFDENDKYETWGLTCVTRCSKRNFDGLVSLSLYSTLPICGSGGRRVSSSSSSGHTSQLVGGLVPGSKRSKNESMSTAGIAAFDGISSKAPTKREWKSFHRTVIATTLRRATVVARSP